MQQHGNEIVIRYRTAMGLNEVSCIDNHLNSVKYPLQKRQILYEFLRFCYHLGLLADMVYTGFLLVCPGSLLPLLFHFVFVLSKYRCRLSKDRDCP